MKVMSKGVEELQHERRQSGDAEATDQPHANRCERTHLAQQIKEAGGERNADEKDESEAVRAFPDRPTSGRSTARIPAPLP
jgi:hypothetical protein